MATTADVSLPVPPLPPLAGRAPRARCLRRGDAGFPARFAAMTAAAPAEVWIDGAAPGDGEPVVAVVGARAASRAACAAIEDLAAALGEARVAVVSGGALGIDAAAHRGALAARGRTFAVLGCGIDVVYPDRHGPLFGQIVAAGGGLLSEHGPGVPPRREQFPSRNRLVAALADAVVIGECRPGSGALITATFARKLGRRLLAVPGSPGADALLARGFASPVVAGDDVLAALRGEVRDASPPARAQAAEAAVAAAPVLAALAAGPAAPATIAARLGAPLSEVLAELLEAELAGLIVRMAGGRYEVLRGD